MPARIDHPAVREQVRLLYIANGGNLTLAASTVGVPVDRAEKWKERGSWDTKQPETRQIAVSESVGKTADSLASLLEQDSNASKIGFSKASRKAAESLATKPATMLLDKDTAQAAKHWHGIASGTHGWEEKQQQTNVMVNIALLGVDPNSVRVETPDVIDLGNTPGTSEPTP